MTVEQDPFAKRERDIIRATHVMIERMSESPVDPGELIGEVAKELNIYRQDASYAFLSLDTIDVGHGRVIYDDSRYQS